MSDQGMKWAVAVVAVGLSTAAFGCEDGASADGGSAASATASATAAATSAGSSSAVASADADPDKKKKKKKRGSDKKSDKCPNAVAGSETKVTEIDGGVEMTVTAKDPDAVAQIHKRAKIVVDAKAKEGGAKRKHTGDGKGGGGLGGCPVVLRDTTIVVVELPDGSKFTIKANAADEVDSLRRDVKQRRAALAGSP